MIFQSVVQLFNDDILSRQIGRLPENLLNHFHSMPLNEGLRIARAHMGKEFISRQLQPDMIVQTLSAVIGHADINPVPS